MPGFQYPFIRLTGRKHVHVALFACAIAFLPWAARSATWNAGDYAALTNAITSAVNGDTIAISQNITVSNAVAISSKGLTIEGNDYSISVPVPGFDESGVTNGGSASTFRVFTISASGKTNFIQNLTVKGGNAAGAINNASGSTLMLEDMTITQSGGISGGGGGVVNSGKLYLQNCNVSRNGASYGGGFLNSGASSTMFIEDCTFSENRSLAANGGGGGGVNYGGYLYVNNSTFAHNKSTELGGAFENYLGGTTSFFVNCTFAGNIAYGTGYKGGAIAQNGGSIKLVNSLFAYNYWNNSGNYVLNDLENYAGTGTNISAYYCVFHSTTNQLLISVSNTLYTGATNGSDDSIFAGGANTIVLNAGGAPLGTNTIYQPFLVRLAATNLTPTALLQSNASPSFAVGKGCRAAFSSSQTTPVVGYYSNDTQWVDLNGTNSSNFEVLDDQNGMNRTNSLIVGAAVGTASNLFMLKVVATNGGTVSGASVYGDIYPSGTVVTVTAIPAVSNLFVRWDYVLGGSGTASSNNPYLVAVNTNITLLPVFTNFNGFNGWLAIQLTPANGSWSLTAPAGYTGPTSGTGNLAAVSAVTGQYYLAWGALSGYVAPSNQAQFVTGGNTTLFIAVYLQISTNINTPSGVNATEGTYTNKIRVVWNGVAGATGYEIWRSETNDADTAGRIANIPANSSLLMKSGNTYSYDDYNVSPINAYYYWVRAKTSSLISPMSYVGMGYAALSPDQKTGTADIGVGDFVYLPVNAISLSHAGTVSCRVTNNGPDSLSSSGVGFDFHMGTNTASMVWIGSAQSNLSLNAGQEVLVILKPAAKQGLTVRGDLSGTQTAKVTVRHLSTLNDPNLANNTTTAAGSVRIKTSGVNSPGRSVNDYDGDGKSDGCLYQSVLGRWYGELSGIRYGEYVWIGDVGIGWTPVPGDYDGDGITDVAAYDRLNGQWLLRFSSDGQVVACQYGGPEFTAVPCDIDGDAKTDLVVYREPDGYWAGAASSRGYVSCYTYLGEAGYQPVMADYDGDGLADPAVYNQESGLWGIALSGSGYQLMTGLFGGIGDLPASADYDGDGLTDPAVYAPATAYWQVLLSGSLATHGYYTWWGGTAGDINGIPVPADYDGDGKADIAVYHQDTGIWEIFLSTSGYQELSGGFGGPAYQPARE